MTILHENNFYDFIKRLQQVRFISASSDNIEELRKECENLERIVMDAEEENIRENPEFMHAWHTSKIVDACIVLLSQATNKELREFAKKELSAVSISILSYLQSQ